MSVFSSTVFYNYGINNITSLTQTTEIFEYEETKAYK